MATPPINDVMQYLRESLAPREGTDRTDEQLLASFIEKRDEAAVAALIQRHGAMVWGVCRRVLRNQHDAEDAFQATFLVLVRRAGSIASRELLANWLYAVARQTALKARAMNAKRRSREMLAAQMPEAEARQVSPTEESLLDGELYRLPDKYRTAVVLCDLEGYTRKEAALQLEIPEGTVAARLARARAMLAKRLLRRGVAISCGTAAWRPNIGSASAPASATSAAIQSATWVAAGGAIAGGVLTPTAAALMQGVLKAMWLSKLKTAAMVLLVAAMAVLGAGLLTRPSAAQQGQLEKPPATANKGDADARKKKAEAVKQERARLAGAWQLVGVELDGKKASRKEVDDVVRVKIIHYAQNFGIKPPKTDGVILVVVCDAEGKWKEQTQGGGGVPLVFSEGTSEINPDEKPKTMDHVVTRRVAGKGFTRRGIYEFVNKDAWRVCFAAPGKIRPDSFAARREDGRILWVFQRVKKDKKADGKEKP